MKITELLAEAGGVGSAIIVDPNYKEPPSPTAKPAPQTAKPIATPAVAPTPAPAPAAKPVQQPAEPAPFNPASYKNTLINTAKAMGITALSDLSNLLAQAQVETANWTKATENFKYTDPTRIYRVFTSNFPSPQHAAQYVGNPVALANRALANKNGNGNEASGDGWNFRGRGFIHLTGRELYAAAGAALHPENPSIYIQNPTLLSSNPTESAKAAVWYYLHKVGKGKTSKQASATVNPAGLKHSERGRAAKEIKQQLVQTTKQKNRRPG
jgi:putative chitinase